MDLRAQLVAKDKEIEELTAAKNATIEELTKQLLKVKVKAGPKIIGLYTRPRTSRTSARCSKAQRVAYLPRPWVSASSARMTKTGRVAMEEAEMEKRIAAHNAWKAASLSK